MQDEAGTNKVPRADESSYPCTSEEGFTGEGGIVQETCTDTTRTANGEELTDNASMRCACNVA